MVRFIFRFLCVLGFALELVLGLAWVLLGLGLPLGLLCWLDFR